MLLEAVFLFQCAFMHAAQPLTSCAASHPSRLRVRLQAKVNARVRYIEGDMTPTEHAEWATQFEVVPEPLTDAEKADFLKTLSGVSLASDAFFPFRDSLDFAAKYGVEFVAQPGGSVQVGWRTRLSACSHQSMDPCRPSACLPITTELPSRSCPSIESNPILLQDEAVTRAADEYGMTMAHGVPRLFHH